MLNNTTTMSTTKTIQSALISVFDKTGLEPIVRQLHQQNATIYSTGGTEDFIKNLPSNTTMPGIAGTNRFTFTHPRLYTPVEVRIVPGSGGEFFNLQYVAPGYWNTSLKFEVMP